MGSAFYRYIGLVGLFIIVNSTSVQAAQPDSIAKQQQQQRIREFQREQQQRRMQEDIAKQQALIQKIQQEKQKGTSETKPQGQSEMMKQKKFGWSGGHKTLPQKKIRKKAKF